MIVIRDMYILKSSGKLWLAMIAEMLLELGYRPSRVDMDVRMNNETNL